MAFLSRDLFERHLERRMTDFALLNQPSRENAKLLVFLADRALGAVDVEHQLGDVRLFFCLGRRATNPTLDLLPKRHGYTSQRLAILFEGSNAQRIGRILSLLRA